MLVQGNGGGWELDMRLFFLLCFVALVSSSDASVERLVEDAFHVLYGSENDGASLEVRVEPNSHFVFPFVLDEGLIRMDVTMRKSPLYQDYFDIPTDADWVEVEAFSDVDRAEDFRPEPYAAKIVEKASQLGGSVVAHKVEYRDSEGAVFAQWEYVHVLFNGMDGKDVFGVFSKINKEVFGMDFTEGVSIKLLKGSEDSGT